MFTIHVSYMEGNGKIGPFASRKAAETCLMGVAVKPNVLTATITGEPDQKK